MHNYRKLFVVCALVCAVFFTSPDVSANQASTRTSRVFFAGKFIRTELYFGTDKPDGGKVTAQEWDEFLEREVSPRFPDGFTVLEGYGQFRHSSGKIVREASIILVIFYPKKTRAAVDAKIEELRDNYKKQFRQESVLRLDYLKSVNVRF